MAESTKGLRLKPTSGDLISVAKSDGVEQIIFPNRDAKFMREGFILPQVEGEGARQMELRQEQASKEAYKERLFNKIASNTGSNVSDLRNGSNQERNTHRVHSMFYGTPNVTQYFDMSLNDGTQSDIDPVSSYRTAPEDDMESLYSLATSSQYYVRHQSSACADYGEAANRQWQSA